MDRLITHNPERYSHRHLRILQQIEQELEQVFDPATPMAVPDQQ